MSRVHFPHFDRQVHQHPGGADPAGGHAAWPPHRLADARRGHQGQSHPGLCRGSDGHSAGQRPPPHRQHAADGHLRSAVRRRLDLRRILRVRMPQRPAVFELTEVTEGNESLQRCF